jgi:hypothetical protein
MKYQKRIFGKNETMAIEEKGWRGISEEIIVGMLEMETAKPARRLSNDR